MLNYFILLAIDDPYFISTRLNGSLLYQRFIPLFGLLFKTAFLLDPYFFAADLFFRTKLNVPFVIPNLRLRSDHLLLHCVEIIELFPFLGGGVYRCFPKLIDHQILQWRSLVNGKMQKKKLGIFSFMG
uniref:Uncharacterized protein n=1 Tax=Populus davidiana TaxID=266767 RepID=A0A6M2E9E5_9ROSI